MTVMMIYYIHVCENLPYIYIHIQKVRQNFQQLSIKNQSRCHFKGIKSNGHANLLLLLMIDMS